MFKNEVRASVQFRPSILLRSTKRMVSNVSAYRTEHMFCSSITHQRSCKISNQRHHHEQDQNLAKGKRILVRVPLCHRLFAKSPRQYPDLPALKCNEPRHRKEDNQPKGSRTKAVSKKQRQTAEPEKPGPCYKNQCPVVFVTAREIPVLFDENVHKECQKHRKINHIDKVNHFPRLRFNSCLARLRPETKLRVPVEVARYPDYAVHGKEAVNDLKMVVWDGIDLYKGSHDEGNSCDILRGVRILDSFPAVAPIDQSRGLTWSSRRNG